MQRQLYRPSAQMQLSGVSSLTFASSNMYQGALLRRAAGSRQLDEPKENEQSQLRSYNMLLWLQCTKIMLTQLSQFLCGLCMCFCASLMCMSWKRWALQAVAAEGAAADAQAQAGPEAEGCTGHRPALAGPPPLHHGLYSCLLRQPCNLPICLRHATLLYSNKHCSSC